MEQQGKEVHLDTDEARGGSTPGIARYVLGISVLLAIVAMTFVWIIPAMSQGDVEEEATVSGAISSQEDDGDATDGVIEDLSADDARESDLNNASSPSDDAGAVEE